VRFYFDVDAAQGELSSAARQQLVDELRTILPGQDHQLIAGVWQLRYEGKFKRVISDLSTAE